MPLLSKRAARESATAICLRFPFFCSWSKNQPWPKCKNGITGMPFGRTELSLRLWFSKSGALLFGHGPRGWLLRGKGKMYQCLHDLLGLFLVETTKKIKRLKNGPRPSQKMQLDRGTSGNGFLGQKLNKKNRKRIGFSFLLTVWRESHFLFQRISYQRYSPY